MHSGDSFSLTCSLRNPGHAELRWLKRLDGIRPPNSEKDVVKLEDQLLYRVSIHEVGRFATDLEVEWRISLQHRIRTV